MFQTEPILWLQANGPATLTRLMRLVSELGYARFFIVVLTVTIFAVSLRKGFVLLQLVLWTALVTAVLKNLAALPRPLFVDGRILDLEYGLPNQTLLEGRGASRFLALLDPEVVAAFRAGPSPSYGFPSGHVSTNVALWGGFWALWRGRLLAGVAVVVTLLMLLSRMHLGKHFLAGSLGGAAVGLVILGLAWTLLLRGEGPQRVEALRVVRLARPTWVGVDLAIFGVPALLVLLAGVSPSLAGYLFGVSLAFGVLLRRGLPAEGGAVWKRAARVALAFALLGLARLVLGPLTGLIYPEGSGVQLYVMAAASGFVLLFCTVLLSERLGLCVRD